jgi:hypothetical protein
MPASEYETWGGPPRSNLRVKLADNGLLRLLPPSGDGEQLVIMSVGGGEFILSYPSATRVWTDGEVQGE